MPPDIRWQNIVDIPGMIKNKFMDTNAEKHRIQRIINALKSGNDIDEDIYNELKELIKKLKNLSLNNGIIVQIPSKKRA